MLKFVADFFSWFLIVMIWLLRSDYVERNFTVRNEYREDVSVMSLWKMRR